MALARHAPPFTPEGRQVAMDATDRLTSSGSEEAQDEIDVVDNARRRKRRVGGVPRGVGGEGGGHSPGGTPPLLRC